MPTCAMCETEARDDASTCHECDGQSCEGDGCGIWCGDCGEWTCSNCIGFNSDGDLCSCCEG